MKTPKPAKNPKYILELTMGDDQYKAKGDTVFEALLSLKKPSKIMAKGILTVSHGKNQKVLPMSPVRIKQLFFTGKSLLEVKAKQIGMGV